MVEVCNYIDISFLLLESMIFLLAEGHLIYIFFSEIRTVGKLIWIGDLCLYHSYIFYHIIGTKSLVNHYVISLRQQANFCLYVLVYYPVVPVHVHYILCPSLIGS